MPNLSAVPGSPQSSTSTVNDSVVVPVERVTWAVPVNVACVFGPQVPPVMNNPSNDVAFMRTPADLSLNSRFPVGVPLPCASCTTKPKLACDLGSARLGTSAGTDKSTPPTEKTGSPWIWPPPVTFPGVGQAPPADAVSHGVKSTTPSGSMTLSPVPPGLLRFMGPVELPHQLFSAFSVPL